MPGVSQGIQELVPSLDREIAAMTTSSKQSVEIYEEMRYVEDNKDDE